MVHTYSVIIENNLYTRFDGQTLACRHGDVSTYLDNGIGSPYTFYFAGNNLFHRRIVATFAISTVVFHRFVITTSDKCHRHQSRTY